MSGHSVNMVRASIISGNPSRRPSTKKWNFEFKRLSVMSTDNIKSGIIYSVDFHKTQITERTLIISESGLFSIFVARLFLKIISEQ